MRPNLEQIRLILQSGIAAPSAENKHYLSFELHADGVRLRATDAASWAVTPHRRFLALLSYGAVAENMALRAGELGYAQSAHWQLDGSADGPIAEFSWTASLQPSDPLAAAIAARHTNRRFYRRTPLAPASLQHMADAVQRVPEARLLWLDTPALRSAALEAIRIAETERFRQPELHRELFGAVRFELGWRRSADEWLAPAALEVEPPMRAPFAMLRRWPLMRALCHVGVHHMLGLRAAALPCRLAPHLGLIVAAGVDAADRALQGGRALQRAWLAASAGGLAFQPMAAATVLLQQRAGDGWVSAGTQARLAELLAPLSPTASAEPCMFFRVGHAAPPSVVSGRRPLEDYLLAEPEGAGNGR
jgi:hypothetical protein